MPPHQAPTDLENAIPFGSQMHLSSSVKSLKSSSSSSSLNNNTMNKTKNLSSTENLKGTTLSNPSGANLQGKKTQGEKRKALVDITNQSSSHHLHPQQLAQQQQQPALKKVKTTIQVFNDDTSNNNTNHTNTMNTSQPKQQVSSKLSSTSKSSLRSRDLSKSSQQQLPSFKQVGRLETIQTINLPQENEIEYCPEPYELAEYPTPVYSEINSLTGEAEDLFITLSDEKMKELTKLPSKDGSFLSFHVNELIQGNNNTASSDSANSSVGTNTVPPSPLPQPLTPVSFDDLFNFEVL
ncbi:hypothetical protein C9374_010091 [Naegleria lovaniensis]|uniref:Uncharacterized protein n=1 Tax=Naegleria lovaniensis TaxID=51637 RepID=A0AA88GGC3_NAELO|nr:uncharacterized protein C9374_010091 [Naegleria lovaniensis]KAG2375087.1 hypothetical protein C9374_010091 [Naegleria lovaniensis]